MSAQPNGETLQVAVVSDRGLSEKRPLNEDSFLSDQQHGIFAVADGVGGAQAGEVASKTAVEVLAEAFQHPVAGTDIEDLMEIAIQRANSSIHQMAQEQPQLSAMATTIVALHLDGHIATIGHVGDSRLYRLSPDGQLHRETADHSVVEEEVRAGRMTPEQAAHHPSRNVISRALGAEPTVEVDMKTREVVDGTAFLLCSDGITRHIPDDELRALLASNQTVEAVCAEMKRRCYERGAEDNLTALIVRVGAENAFHFDDERTLLAAHPDLDRTVDSAGNPPAPTAASMPASSTPNSPMAAPSSALPPPPVSPANALPANPVMALGSQAKTRSGKSGLRNFFLLLLILAVAAGAFFGGIYYQRYQSENSAQANPKETPKTEPKPDPIHDFEKKRHEVDKKPLAEIKEDAKKIMEAKQGTQSPFDSINDAETLYLDGRTLFRAGDYNNAWTAFERASKTHVEGSPELDRLLKIDSRLALGATVLMMPKVNVLSSPIVKEAKDELGNLATDNPTATH